MRTLHILVVEDSHRDFVLIQRHLRKSGLDFDCREAGDRDAIATALAEGGWDLVLADYRIPGVAWEDNVAAIRAHDPDLPIILVSGAIGEENAAAILRQGVADFVLKDHLARLVPAIERSLQEVAERHARQGAERALRKSRELLRTITDAVPALISYIDTDYRYRLVNRGYQRWFGLRPQAVVGQDPASVLGAAAWATVRPWMARAMAGEAVDFEREVPYRFGGTRWARMTYTPDRDEQGHVRGIVILVHDISDRKRAELALERSRESFAAIVESAMDAIISIDGEQRIVLFNAAAETMFGRPAEEVLGQPLDRLLPERFRDGHGGHVRAFLQGEATAQRIDPRRPLSGLRADGSEFPIEASISKVELDGRLQATVIVRDISELRKAQESIRTAALHDPLTGLPNRALIFEFGGHDLAATARAGGHTALLFIDLDRFKPINDTYGHAAGDIVLQEVAQRLRQCTRKADLVGRLGGDEFVILLAHEQGDDSRRQETVVAQHVIEAIRRPIVHGEHGFSVTPSVGISLYPEHGSDIDALIRAADLAMYHAKRSGPAGYRVYAPDMQSGAAEALRLEARLRHALAHGGLELHYQPVVDLASGRLTGAEALVRLRAEDGGLVGPGTFIPVAEATGLIDDLGAWVAAEACRQQRVWLRQGLAPLHVAINVSPQQFKARGFAQRLGDIVAASGVDPAWLHLEITESTVIDRIDEAIGTLNELRARGMRVALDDFGTGYSSLSLLGRLPLDKLKIDQAFVRRMQDDPASLAVTRAIIAMGKNLDLVLVAEGVESRHAFEELRDSGCEQAQGFLIGQPLPPAAFERWRLRH